MNPDQILEMMTDEHPMGDYDRDDETLSKSEVRTRIIHILRHFPTIDLRNIDWNAHIMNGLGLDSLDRIALLTSVEHEFKTIFEDNLFDNLDTLNQVVNEVSTSRLAF